MKKLYKTGDKKQYAFTVEAKDVARFHGETVHEVCSTFVLAREVEWSTRLFVLDMTESDEEGVGTMLEIKHKSPAFVGETVLIEAEVERFENNELICNYAARVHDRLVAVGQTGQKILKKDKIKEIFSTFK
ncbi:MAG: hotdog domain-containing protein [Fulvivirga sp.]